MVSHGRVAKEFIQHVWLKCVQSVVDADNLLVGEGQGLIRAQVSPITLKNSRHYLLHAMYSKRASVDNGNGKDW